jgi:hypothetical protein
LHKHFSQQRLHDQALAAYRHSDPLLTVVGKSLFVVIDLSIMASSIPANITSVEASPLGLVTISSDPGDSRANGWAVIQRGTMDQAGDCLLVFTVTLIDGSVLKPMVALTIAAVSS